MHVDVHMEEHAMLLQMKGVVFLERIVAVELISSFAL